MMAAILDVLNKGSPLSRGAACSALVESTFRNADNALLVAKTPGMMQGVVAVMQEASGDERDDAAGVLRNCSNYSQEAAEVIVCTPGVLDALIEMCKGQHNSDRFTAMGTIQNLTRCSSVVPLLRGTRVVTDALLPSLHAMGAGEEHDVMRAEALMAVVNLSSDEQLEELEAEADVTAVIVQMLRCAVKGEAWKDVAWYDAEECLRPLAKLTLNSGNREFLRKSGFILVLANLLFRWLEVKSDRLPAFVHIEAEKRNGILSHLGYSLRPAHFLGFDTSRTEAHRKSANIFCEPVGPDSKSFRHTLGVWEAAEGFQAKDDTLELLPGITVLAKEIDLAVLALVNMARDATSASIMLDLGLPRILRAVGTATRQMRPNGPQFCGADLWVLQDRHLAMSMGHHPRLGSQENALLMCLDAPVLWMIMQEASTVSDCASCLAEALDGREKASSPRQAATEPEPMADVQHNGKTSSISRWARSWRPSGPDPMDTDADGQMADRSG
mmetsp:Transcript_34233/g.53396  ORF Transcript_34233/g.53396 Transcript_34233/m.53396 type:complete len:499 (-) Transcript_34233:270-1766(-)